MKLIQLTKGFVATVDDCDYPVVSKHKWRTFENGSGKLYASRKVAGRIVLLHRFILAAPSSRLVDHRDGNGLNCTRQNLRLCDPAGNAQNARKRHDNTSGFKGVSWHKATKKWRATINSAGRQIALGYFRDALDAAKAYDRAAKQLFGEFSHPNFG